MSSARDERAATTTQNAGAKPSPVWGARRAGCGGGGLAGGAVGAVVGVAVGVAVGRAAW